MLSPIPFDENKWLRSFLIHIAARQLQRFYQKQVNDQLITEQLKKGTLRAVNKTLQRRRDIVFYAGETTENTNDYVDANAKDDKLSQPEHMLYQYAKELFHTIMLAVTSAHIDKKDIDLSHIPVRFHHITRSYHIAIDPVFETELRKVSASYSPSIMDENTQEAQEQEQQNRQKSYEDKSEFKDKNADDDQLFANKQFIGNIVTAQGKRSYMEDRVLAVHDKTLLTMPSQQIPKLLSLFALRLASNCLLDPATHHNGSTCASAFIVGETIYTMSLGDSSVFLTYQDESGYYHCERITPEQRPNTKREKFRLLSEGAKLYLDDTRLGDLRHGHIGVASSFGHYAQYGQWKGLSPYPLIGRRDISDLKKPRVIICSDGLTDGLNEVIIENYLNKCGFVGGTGEELRKIAQRHGSKDNIGIAIFNALSGMIGAVFDGHGYPQQGHVTSAKLHMLFIPILHHLVAKLPEHLASLDELLDVIPTPTLSLSGTLELDSSTGEVSSPPPSPLSQSPERKRVKLVETSQSQPLAEITERPVFSRSASLPVLFPCRSERDAADEKAQLRRSNQGAYVK